ncbi:MAG: peptide ABC transporter substrate-binding protein [Woeseiaceae bacterium]|jgi:oligopeptide transport system substrate-binding protein|nr:peptide ABC transporter substrate-binding protein [Woeseiaceae bacterium]
MTESKANRKHVYLLLAAAIVAAGVFALWPAPTERETSRAAADTLHRGIGAAPESFDPHKARSVQASIVFRDLGEGLTGYTAAGELVPAAAESWELSEDGLVYTFRLRDTARWSNGEPVTADDFVFTFRRIVDPATAALNAGAIGPIANGPAIVAGGLPPESLGVSALDDLTLEITLSQPTPYFLALLTHPSTFPQNAANIEAHGAGHARPGVLVTNGPYRLAAVEPSSLIELERNPHYWNDAATAIDRVHYHVLVEPMSEYNRFRAGELHTTSTVPTDIFASVREQFPAALRVAPSLGIYYYGYNVTRPPFKDNLPLRQALSMAIDREVLVEKITGRGEEPAYSWIPPGIPGYEPPRLPFELMSQEERNAQARRLYYSAGYSDDKPARIELRYNTSDEHERIALAIQSMWRDVLGVETTLINEEFQVLLANMRERKVTEVFRSSWNGDYNDAHTFLSIFESGSPWNLSGWSNAEYDSLMRRASTQLNPETRRRYLEEAERLLLAEYPVIPLYYYVSKHLVSPEVEGWEDNILDYHYSHHLSLGAEGS